MTYKLTLSATCFDQKNNENEKCFWWARNHSKFGLKIYWCLFILDF